MKSETLIIILCALIAIGLGACVAWYLWNAFQALMLAL
jgi:Flp pilus assembly protein CpaB